MFSRNIFRLSAAVLALVGSSLIADPIIYDMTGPSGDGTMSYNGSQREAWLKSAIDGYVVAQTTGTPQAADVGNLFGGTWYKEGELTAVGTNDLLKVTLTSGSWGAGPMTGTWEINPAFWLTYGNAVISLHVGNGSGDPDWFLWEISSNQSTGSFYYSRIDGGGGGLSNIFLWGGGSPTKVPDGGYSAIFIGLGLIAVALIRRQAR